MTRRYIPLLLCATMAGAGGSTALAQTIAPTDLSRVRRLSPEEKERILANSSEAVADASLMSAMGGGGGGSGQIHGEVGAMVRTHGAFGVFGTALVPLGENGSAILSFSKSQLGDLGRPHR